MLSTSGLVASLAISRHSHSKQSEEFRAHSVEESKGFESQKGKFLKQIDFLEEEKKGLKTTLSHAREENKMSSENLRNKERELRETKDDLAKAQVLSNNNPPREFITASYHPQPSQPLVPPSKAEKIIDWTKQNTMLIFPVSLNVTNEKVILHDRDKKVKIPISPGGKVTAIGYHPSSLAIGNTNFIEAIQPSFQKYTKRVARK